MMNMTITTTTSTIPTRKNNWCPIFQHKCKKSCMAMDNGQCSIIQAMLRSYPPPYPIQPYPWELGKPYCDHSFVYTDNSR